MIRKFTVGIAVAAAALVLPLAVAFAAVTFDPATGYGFVGKGDVQLVYGWSNKALQANAELVQLQSQSVTEVSWECHRYNPQGTEIVQVRARTTTTQGLVSKIDRVKNQITGFILNGYAGAPTSSTEGPALDSCPSASAGWSLKTPAGDPVVISSLLQVSINNQDWFNLN